MKLTDGATITRDMIKREKYIFNQEIKFPRYTKRRIQKIAVKNGWNTQIVQILREISDGN